MIKILRALKKVGYKIDGLANRVSYGTGDFDTLSIYQNERQFRQFISNNKETYSGVIWSNEPDPPVKWLREELGDSVPLIVDLHDLDSVRRQMIPIPEREMFNLANGLVYVSSPIRELTNKLHRVTVPTINLLSYCNNDIILEYDEGQISSRKSLIYEGGANPPEDTELNAIFAYRSLYDIIRKLVEMGNETHMYCGNVTAYESYQDTGAVLYPPTDYDQMMKGLTRFKYGVLVFNNEDGKKEQVNLTLTNKEHEYLQAGLPSLACWCPESEKHVAKHGTGFVFKHIDEIGDCSRLEEKYFEIMDNIKIKRKELVMENFIWKLENLFAKVLNVEGKGIPDNIRKINEFEYGKKDVEETLAHI